MLGTYELEVLRLSLFVATCACIIFLPFACFWVAIYDRYRFYGRTALDILFHLPLVVPPVVVGYLLLYLLGKQGFIGAKLYAWTGISLAFSWKAAVLASGVMALPLMIRAMRTSLESMDRGLEAAARTLGASRTRAFFSITFAQIMPGFSSALLLGFVRAFGEFGATITFAGSIPSVTRTLPLAIYNYTLIPGAEADAVRLSIIACLVASAAMLASGLLHRSKHRAERRLQI